MTEELKIVSGEIAQKLAAAQAQAALYAALAKAQGEFAPVAKNRAVQIRMKEGGTYKFEYADLEQLISCTRPALAKNGLAVVQLITDGELHTQLVHQDGGNLQSSMKLPMPGQDPKAFGAAVTYMRRYAYGALLCLAADDDLDEDGQEAGHPGVDHNPTPHPTARPAARAEHAPSKDDPLGETGGPASQGEINWAKTKLGKLDAGDAQQLLAKHGIQGLDKGLSKAAFLALKADLLKA